MIEHEVQDNQEIVAIGNETFVADKDFIPLLKELNRVGLKTVEHCSGHGKYLPYLSIDLSSDVEVVIRKRGNGSKLVIYWGNEGVNK